MRVNIDFNVNDNFTFKNYLSEAMTAFIYRCIKISDKKYSKTLHDNGFRQSGHKKFVYHAYSFTQDNKIVKDELHKGTSSLIITSALDDTIIKFVEGLIKIGKVQLFSHSFDIGNISYLKDPKLADSGLFKTLSPIYMQDGVHKWLSPIDMEENLRANLIERYYALYDRLPKNLDITIKFLKSSPTYIKYKLCTFKAWTGIIAVQGSKDLIEIAYQSGLGSKCGLGLGVLEKL